MKKIINKSIAIASIFSASLLFTVTAASAGNVLSTQASAGALITVAEVLGNGPGLTFSPSPSVLLVVSSTNNAYAITTMNSSAQDGDRNEYGVFSGYGGYYQNVNASTASPPVFGVVLVAADAATGDPFGAWTQMGGGS